MTTRTSPPARAAHLLLLALAAACAPPAAVPSPAPAAAPAPLRLRVVHTNDVHGRLLSQTGADGRAFGGAAVMAAHFDSAAARFRGPTIILSAGDEMQGTAVSNLTWGRATIQANNAAGYDAAAIGNHEFDWGQDTLAARVADSRYAGLAANLFVAGTRTHPSWVRPWTMIERGGARIAVVGVALRTTPEVVLAGRTAGLEFGPEAPAVDAAAREARAAGADFVIVDAHVGAYCETPGRAPEELSTGCRGELLDLARALAAPVDLIVGGHSHTRVMTTENGIPIVEASSYARAYSITDLEKRDGRTVAVARSIRTPYADEVTPDTQVARVVAAWEREVTPLTERPIARLTSALTSAAGPGGDEGALGNLMADAFRVQTGTEASIINNGSIRAGLPAGTVTWGNAFELQPFANVLVRTEVTGVQLRAALENAVAGREHPDAHISGMTVTWDPSAATGSRIREVRLASGRVVRDTDTVTLGLSEFLATGGDRYTSLAQGRTTRTALVDLDALIAYLQSLPQPVAAPQTGRWRRVR
jgi:2',3'-cyclic-nucleotide 2'-phosphodiesterase (5'-nucleotidase family)